MRHKKRDIRNKQKSNYDNVLNVLLTYLFHKQVRRRPHTHTLKNTYISYLF